MTWVPPFFTCGECGGEIGRWPMFNLLKQEILDWRHKTVPEDVTEHRAVLGTPAHRPRIPISGDQAKVDIKAEPVPKPYIPARPATPEEMPGPAVRLTKKAADHGWECRAVYMAGPLMTASWQFSRMVESVVVQLKRDGVRLVAAWQTRYGEADWSFDLAYELDRTARPLSSPELNAAVKFPRIFCEDCGEPPALHVRLDNGDLICHHSWQAERRRAS